LRILRRQVKKTLEELQRGYPLSDEAVHDARKRIKKARSALRDTARPRTAVRDATALGGHR
jgi:hypothetical protein